MMREALIGMDDGVKVAGEAIWLVDIQAITVNSKEGLQRIPN